MLDFVRCGARHSACCKPAFAPASLLLLITLTMGLMTSDAQARSRKHVKKSPTNKTALAQPDKQSEPMPKGPLTIVVSIAKQSLTLYDGLDNIATTPVSTGVPGHETPKGIFSIIQKDRFHRSNLYSNAPMPYMQRITWSGVALHEGHVTGRVASHGCVRLPQAFAQRLWGMTKLGARVIIVQDDVSLAEIAAPALLAARPVPQLQVPIEPAADVVFPKDWLPTPASEPVSLPAVLEPVVLAQQDTSVSASEERRVEESLAQESLAQVTLAETDSTKATESDLASDLAKAEEPPIQQEVVAILDLGPLPPEAEVKLERADLVQTDIAMNKASMNDGPVGAIAENVIAAQDLAFPDTMKLVETRAPVTLDPKAGPLAILISKREGKLMIRQNFKSVYEVPVQFESGEHLLGTHLYSALGTLDSGLRWSSVTLPSAQAIQMERERLARPAQRKNTKGVQIASRGDVDLPEMFLSAEQALQSVRIPDEAANLIAAALTPGSSLIISDLAQGYETGRGTDFIVLAK